MVTTATSIDCRFNRQILTTHATRPPNLNQNEKYARRAARLEDTLKRKHYKTHSARSRIQRAFFEWFDENRNRFKVPFRIAKRTAQYIFLEAISSKLRVHATIMTRARCLDISLSLGDSSSFNDLLTTYVNPVLTSDGYACAFDHNAEEFGNFCLDERKPYPTPDEVWRVHLFEVLLDYVNNTFTKFPWIEIYEIPIKSFVDDVEVKIGTGHAPYPLMSQDQPRSPYREENRTLEIIPNPFYVP